MEIKRDFYLNELLRKRGNGLVKVITGLRRCGKSYLMRNLFKSRLLAEGLRDDQIIEMAFDERDNLAFRSADTFYDFAKGRLSQTPTCVFLLDEIQFLEDFESVLNGLLGKGTEVYVTGSNARFLSKDVITEFRGRGDEVHMMPLSFAEYFAAFPGDRSMRFNEYMLYGGLPLVCLATLDEDRIAMLKSLYDETYLRDIVGRNRIRKAAELGDLLDVLSSNIGALVNPEKLQKVFHSVKKSKIGAATISKYLGYLEEAYLLEGARRYDIKGNAYIETPMKYYYADLGLRNARLNFRQLEETHSMENIIFNELRRRRFNVDIGVVTVNEQHDGSSRRRQLEVDFVANKGSKRYYVQSAYMIPDEAKREQEIRPLRKIDDSFRKVIVTANPAPPWYDNTGVLTISVFDFLLDPNSLDF